MASIPIIDISLLVSRYHNKRLDLVQFSEDEDIRDLSDQLSHVLGTWGFVYLKGHMISESLIERAFEEGKKFFQLDGPTKQKMKRPAKYDDCGYVSVNTEGLSPERPPDYKEGFTLAPNCQVESKAEIAHQTLWNTEIQLFKEFQ